MATFLHGSELNTEIERIVRNAKYQLLIISPFIKFHPRFRAALKSQIENHKLEIIIVFGKNEEKIHKSLSKEDFEFLKEFSNVKIKYESRLHAKYYASENAAILSSMNLYDFSQNNNIEFGIYTEPQNILGSITNTITGNSFDNEAYEYFYEEVIKQSETYFEKTPVYKDGFLKNVLKNYSHSEIKKDLLTEIFRENGSKPNKRSSKTQSAGKKNETHIGYCIRTGEQIPFNPEKPLSHKAFKQWNKYGDPEYSEKYCHYSGEPSKGETSVAKPILKKNWKKAMKN